MHSRPESTRLGRRKGERHASGGRCLTWPLFRFEASSMTMEIEQKNKDSKLFLSVPQRRKRKLRLMLRRSSPRGAARRRGGRRAGRGGDGGEKVAPARCCSGLIDSSAADVSSPDIVVLAWSSARGGRCAHRALAASREGRRWRRRQQDQKRIREKQERERGFFYLAALSLSVRKF